MKLDTAVEFAVLAVGMTFFHSLMGDSRFLSVGFHSEIQSHSSMFVSFAVKGL